MRRGGNKGSNNNISIINRRLIASDLSIKGNKRDYNILSNQTLGKEGGVQCVLTAVSMYVYIYIYLILYISNSEERLKLGLLL